MFSRKSTGTADWAAARRVAEGFEKAGSWSGTPIVLPPPPSDAAPEKPRVTIEAACRAYIANRDAAGLKPPTLRKYHTFAKQIRHFADGLGYVMLDQFTADDIDRFWANWKLGPRAKGKRLTTLRAFFRFSVNRKWIPESPVSSDIKAPVGSSRGANKAPFTDNEINRIIAACEKVKVEWKNETGTGEWTGDDLKDLVWLMLYTGFRISDATLFSIKRLHRDQVFVRAKKNGGDVFAYVPDWLQERLKARAARFGERPFIVARSDRLETITNIWRRRLAKRFEAAGSFDETPTPHRLRHTFARILLQKGVPVADVADLLGDDEKTVREHYARWVSITARSASPVVGFVKRLFQLYVPVEQLVVVRRLPAGARSPVFLIRSTGRFGRYSWFVRLATPLTVESEFTGIVRLEVAEAGGLQQAVSLANAITTWLPRLVPSRTRDPRAPQKPDSNRSTRAATSSSNGDSRLIHRRLATRLARESTHV